MCSAYTVYVIHTHGCYFLFDAHHNCAFPLDAQSFLLFEWVGLAHETKYVYTCSASMVVHGMIPVHATFLLAHELYIIIN